MKCNPIIGRDRERGEGEVERGEERDIDTEEREKENVCHRGSQGRLQRGGLGKVGTLVLGNVPW